MTVDGRLFLAPLAGVSNLPFRTLARQFGAALCYTGMISSEAVIRGQKKTFHLIDIANNEHPVGIQLFGSSPEVIGQAVKRILEFNPDLIDLNLGCPVKKVVKKNGGAALLKNIQLTGELMAAAVENSTVPITIKIRSGWDAQSDIYIDLGNIARKTGVSAITLHPRSRNQDYSRQADWLKIADLKRNVKIPVIGNGDINTPSDAAKMLSQTGCDAIMIGRAAMRNPYIFMQIKSFLENGTILPDLDISQKIDLALKHARLLIENKGEKLGSIMMRKHLAWYTTGFPEGTALRREIKTVCSFNDINMLLTDYLAKIKTSAQKASDYV